MTIIVHRGMNVKTSHFPDLNRSRKVNLGDSGPVSWPPQAAVLKTLLGSVIPCSTLTWSSTTFLHHFPRALCSTLLLYRAQASRTYVVQCPGIPARYSVIRNAMGSHRQSLNNLCTV